MQYEIASVAVFPRKDTVNVVRCHCEAASAEAIPYDRVLAAEHYRNDISQYSCVVSQLPQAGVHRCEL